MLQFLLSISDESNHDKIEKLFYKYHDGMLRYAQRKLLYCNNSDYVHNAEDAVQNTFVKIVKKIDEIDFSKGERFVKSLVFSYLISEIYKILKKNKVFLEFDEEIYPNEDYNIIDELDMQENYEKVVKAVEELDEKYSTTLFLYFNKEMSIKEIANMMGISEKTVYTRFERGKKLLINKIKGCK